MTLFRHQRAKSWSDATFLNKLYEHPDFK